MRLIEQIIPPLLMQMLRSSRFRRYGWFGDFETWQAAANASKGYNQEIILEKVKNAVLKVRNGQAAFERDSVTFDTPQYNWPLIAWLSWIAALYKGYLNVLDFGGSLGSTYFQNKVFIDPLHAQWNIVEQGHFVKTGKELFESKELRFYHAVDDCLKENAVNVALLSSVLPYLENPYSQLDTFEKIDFLILDKMPLIKSDRDRITIQKVPPSIYKASYPSWFFSESRFMAFISDKYDIISEIDRNIPANLPAAFKAFLLKRKAN